MEASHLLDMNKLIGNNPHNLLVPLSKKNQSLFRRSHANLGLVLIAITLVMVIYDLFVNANLLLISLYFILLAFFECRHRIKGTYSISEKGFLVPYTWLTRKRIALNSIVEIIDEKLIETETDAEIDGIRIVIDHPGLKFNITGIQESNIVLTSSFYDINDLEIFSEELRKYKRESKGTKNTLAQRLDDQVDRSWSGRWKLIFLNTLDSSTEFGFYLMLTYIIFLVIFGDTISLLFGALFILYFLTVLTFNIADRPSSIIGFRSHELGAMIYNEADLYTNVRFIVSSKPNNVELIDCTLLFQSDPIAQINELKELHPAKIESGVLTYCVAQFAGNQTKSIGVKVKFRYTNQEDQEFELPIYWA